MTSNIFDFKAYVYDEVNKATDAIRKEISNDLRRKFCGRYVKFSILVKDPHETKKQIRYVKGDLVDIVVRNNTKYVVDITLDNGNTYEAYTQHGIETVLVGN